LDTEIENAQGPNRRPEVGVLVMKGRYPTVRTVHQPILVENSLSCEGAKIVTNRDPRSEGARPVMKMHDEEVDVDVSLVRELVAEQFPEWGDLDLRQVPLTGTDNVIFRLGDDMGIRVPRIYWAVSQVDHELEWLDRFAPHLPVEVPIPLAKGEPGRGYPYSWLVYKWLDGEDLSHCHIEDPSRLASDAAEFVLALQQVDPTGAPRQYRVLSKEDDSARAAIRELDGVYDADLMTAIWDAALEAEPLSRQNVWAHNDLLPGNLLTQNGRLTGVIDWSLASAGDPARDGMLAWAFPPEARAVYRNALGFDDATWARARGWVVIQCAQYIPYYADTIPDAVEGAKQRLEAVLSGS